MWKLLKCACLGAAVFVAALVIQCSSDRSLWGDGGAVDRLLTEAGIRDGGLGPKADAAPTGTKYTVYCDKQRVQKITSATASSVTTTYYSELSVPGLDPAKFPRIVILMCESDKTCYNCDFKCPAGMQCTDTGAPQPFACTIFEGAAVDIGRVYINCGTKSETTSSGATTVSGYKYNKIDVLVGL